MSIFEWKNISLTLQRRERHVTVSRKLLSNIDGYVKSGQLLGIQGPSGCGKTSLINALTGRVSFSKNIKLEGDILYNNREVEVGDFDKRIVCISQTDMLFSYLTVRDTLLLSAAFHQSWDTPRSIIEEKVESTIRELGLLKVSETIIGSTSRRGVSGGEYKRVLIGKEMMKDPDIVFVDEPTSGLDAFQALAVMEAMKELTSTGKMVIAVVHQPRSSIFSLFDNLLLLTEGKSVYFGSAKQVLLYLEELGYTVPEHYNPADFYLDLMSVDFRTLDREIESRIRIDHLTSQWLFNRGSFALQEEEQRQQNLVHSFADGRRIRGEPGYPILLGQSFLNTSDATTVELRGPTISRPVQVPAPRAMLTAHKTCLAWFGDFERLAWRSSVEILRNYSSIGIKCATSLFFAVILSLVYHGIGYSQRNIQDRIGVLYFILINQSFGPLVGMLNIFPVEKKIVNREIISGAYTTSSYYLSRVIAEIPLQAINTVVYSSIIYWSIGLNKGYDRFLLFLVVVVLTALCSMSIGLALSAISPTPIVANALGPPILIIFVLFGGFYINIGSLPPGSQWVVYISFIYWAFQALSVNEFIGETFQCAPGSPANCLVTGKQVLVNLNFENGSVSLSISILIVLTVAFLGAGYVGLIVTREKYCQIVPATSSKRHAANARIDSKEEDFQEEIMADIPI